MPSSITLSMFFAWQNNSINSDKSFKPSSGANCELQPCDGKSSKITGCVLSTNSTSYLNDEKLWNAPPKNITGVLWLFSGARSEEHTSELQSRPHLVCRLLLEK